jgi:hypothetical protein
MGEKGLLEEDWNDRNNWKKTGITEATGRRGLYNC